MRVTAGGDIGAAQNFVEYAERDNSTASLQKEATAQLVVIEEDLLALSDALHRACDPEMAFWQHTQVAPLPARVRLRETWVRPVTLPDVAAAADAAARRGAGCAKAGSTATPHCGPQQASSTS